VADGGLNSIVAFWLRAADGTLQIVTGASMNLVESIAFRVFPSCQKEL